MGSCGEEGQNPRHYKESRESNNNNGLGDRGKRKRRCQGGRISPRERADSKEERKGS